MFRRAILRSPAVKKKQPLLTSGNPMTSPATKAPLKKGKISSDATTIEAKAGERKRKKVGEVVGGVAAECAAVWCCCPCAMVNLVILAVYRVPAAVCKKAWRRRKSHSSRRKRQGLFMAAEASDMDGRVRLNLEHPTAEILDDSEEKKGGQNDAVELEMIMWDHFHGAGFWRSPSQRDT